MRTPGKDMVKRCWTPASRDPTARRATGAQVRNGRQRLRHRGELGLVGLVVEAVEGLHRTAAVLLLGREHVGQPARPDHHQSAVERARCRAAAGARAIASSGAIAVEPVDVERPGRGGLGDRAQPGHRGLLEAVDGRRAARCARGRGGHAIRCPAQLERRAVLLATAAGAARSPAARWRRALSTDQTRGLVRRMEVARPEPRAATCTRPSTGSAAALSRR